MDTHASPKATEGSPLAWTALAALVLLALWHAARLSEVNDDAGISLAYARSLAIGEGLRLTPFSPRVEAFSNPLWTLWLSLGFRTGLARGNGGAFAAWSGIVCAALALVPVALLPGRAEGRGLRAVDLVAPALLALDTTFCFWAGSGLESGLFALLLSAGLCALAVELRGRASRGSALCLGLLCVTRPEGPLTVAAAGLARLAALRGRRDASKAAVSAPAARGLVTNPAAGGKLLARALGPELHWALLAILPALLWLALRQLYFARWVPNAFTVKSAWEFLHPGPYLRAWLGSRPPVHLALWLFPLALAVRRTRSTALLAMVGALPALAFILYSGGDWMAMHRFVAHALPAVALAIGAVPVALADLVAGGLLLLRASAARPPAPGATPQRLGAHVPLLRALLQVARLERACALICAALLLAPAARLARSRLRDPPRSDQPLAWVASQGRWLRQKATALGLATPVIAHYDIGGLALEGGAEVVDLSGLADLRMAQVAQRDRQAARDYILAEVQPDLLNVHGPSWYLRQDPRFERDYAEVSRGIFGAHFARRSLLAGGDDRCPGGLAALRELEPRGATALAARLLSLADTGDAEGVLALWRCARAHWPQEWLPLDAAVALGERLAASGAAASDKRRARALLRAALALDPTQARAAQRLERLRVLR